MICSNLCEFGQSAALFLKLRRSRTDLIRLRRRRGAKDSTARRLPLRALQGAVAHLGPSSPLFVLAARLSGVQEGADGGGGRVGKERGKKKKLLPAVWNVAKNNRCGNVAKRETQVEEINC